MNTLNLTIPLTIPQLAKLLRTQFSPDERQQLAELMLESKPKKSKKLKKELPSIADDLREAFIELKQYQRGEIQLQTLEELLEELKNDELQD